MSLLSQIYGALERRIATLNSDRFIEYLRRKGVTIGEHCTFFSPGTQYVDLTRPELIEIGDKVKITLGCTILTHGYDWCVLRDLHPGEIFGSAGTVKIGDNVFLGMRSVILKNVEIGANTIIGAGSIVTRDMPGNSVAAGNPARVVTDIGSYYEKYRERQIAEAKKHALAIFKKRGREPLITDFSEYFFLFCTGEEAEAAGLDVKKQTTPEYYFLFKEKSKPAFPTFEEFKRYCLTDSRGR